MEPSDHRSPELLPGSSPSVLRFFHPVLPARELGNRRPVRVRIAGRNIALFRTAEGIPAALDDACPHRRAPLSLGTVRPDGRLACAYHGWHFDAAGNGKSPACPDLRHCDVGSYQVVERHGYIWLAERTTPLSAFPNLVFGDFIFAGSISTLFEAPIEVALDNISEDEHFAYIHSTFGWDERGASAVQIETETFPDRSTVQLTGSQRRTTFAPLGGVRPGDHFHNEWVTRFEPVHSIYTFWWQHPKSGERRPIKTRAVVFLVPEGPKATRAHMFLFANVAPSWQRSFPAITHWLIRRVALIELRRDARFVAHIADAPTTLRGMRLTRFDKALIHNRKLLTERYWGTPREPRTSDVGRLEPLSVRRTEKQR